MAFFLFLLVNAALFLRPAELIPEWQGVSLYEYLIIACFICALPDVLTHLTGRPLEAQPITLCVFGVLAAIMVAQLPSLNLGEAWRTGFFFFKVVVYYILLISVVNTPARVRFFISWVVWCGALLAVVTLLQYHEVITLSTFKTLTEHELDPITGELTTLGRLQGSGLFNDPNELGVMMAAVVPLALYLLCHSKNGLGILYSVPLGLFLWSIALTHSRGALLALVAGLGALMFTRFGMRRTALLAVCGLPVLLAVFAGRQTSMSAIEGTGQSRLQLWSDWLGEFRASPLFGKGVTIIEDAEKAKEDRTWQGLRHAAHNSYLHAFVELGVFGGFFFLGAFGIALWSVLRLDPRRTAIVDTDMRYLRPFVAGSLTAYAVGLLSLSLCYGVPTYLVLGLTVAFVRVTPHYPALPAARFDGRVAGRIALASVGFLAMTYMLVRLFVRWA